jgi:hypothetical protein
MAIGIPAEYIELRESVLTLNLTAIQRDPQVLDKIVALDRGIDAGTIQTYREESNKTPARVEPPLETRSGEEIYNNYVKKFTNAMEQGRNKDLPPEERYANLRFVLLNKTDQAFTGEDLSILLNGLKEESKETGSNYDRRLEEIGAQLEQADKTEKSPIAKARNSVIARTPNWLSNILPSALTDSNPTFASVTRSLSSVASHIDDKVSNMAQYPQSYDSLPEGPRPYRSAAAAIDSSVKRGEEQYAATVEARNQAAVVEKTATLEQALQRGAPEQPQRNQGDDIEKTGGMPPPGEPQLTTPSSLGVQSKENRR